MSVDESTLPEWRHTSIFCILSNKNIKGTHYKPFSNSAKTSAYGRAKPETDCL
ncbi:hypothetical protein HMPREF3208_00840 [Gardnerella vaginalis]|uniref:Uncharacterized protein n=1 Tax=Gardnerella vaginalis TaxID=2702 RepID=A0A133NVE1_GARVA|nr:hypothetical protein HMPREF3208_00840 [Gardnerella vaginalis]